MMHSSRPLLRTFRAKRRGTIYVAVLGAAILTSLIGVSGIIAARVQAKASVSNGDLDEARTYARAAIEMGRLTIANDPSWRTNQHSGAWFSNRTIGSGTCSLAAANPNSTNLNNASTDPVILTGTGVKGRATQKMQVTLTSSATGMTCLSVPLASGGAMSFTLTTLTSDTVISSNAGMSATLGGIHADVQTVANTVTGSSYFLQKVTTGITPLTMPDSSTAFSYYTTNGTTISYGSLPSSGSVAQISGQLLCASNNPFGGGTNSQGIYVIDCNNSPINIANSRIIGTLVLLHCPLTSTIMNSNLWSPGPANLPILMVQGSITIKQSNAALSEVTANANFNPTGAAYLGATNATKTDTYPSQLQGLIYISGNLTTSVHPVIVGVMIVGGTYTAGSSSIDFTYDSTYAASPPPGFTGATTMKLSEGTWAPVVN